MKTLYNIILLILCTALLFVVVVGVIFALSRSWAFFGALPHPFCYIVEVLFLFFAITQFVLFLLVAAATLWELIDWWRKR